MGVAGSGTGLTFADLLRRHRASAGVTQEDLAHRTGLTPQAIGLLERGKRRRPHAHTVRRLAEVLGLEGWDLTEFESAARPPDTYRAAPSGRTLPPSPTPLVGREHEAAVASDLLLREDVRLLTLTGPGGVGKTRLALEVAARASGGPSGAFADGTVFVPLADVREAAGVPSAVAGKLGVRERAGQPLPETLEHRLRDRHVLVLLDNLEHLPEAASFVADLLGACPRMTVLATSRAPLHLAGEYQFPVPPLSEAGASSTPAGVPGTSAAVELFRQRARAVAPAFDLTDANAPVVAEICRKLDGLPLAIELAAARIRLLSPRALLDRLDHRLRVLAHGARDLPERQRTLRDAISWSHDLLNAEERSLFRRLAVFAGGCTLEAVEAIRGSGRTDDGTADVLEMLASLVDGSLLVPRAEASAGGENGEPRFAMLETIREYAAERLEASGEAAAVRRLHALYYLALAEATQPGTSGHAQGEWWWTPLEKEHDNLRAALRWTVGARDEDTAARLALALWRFWSARHPGEGRRWLEAVLALGGPAGGPKGETGGARDAPRARRRAFLLLVAGILAARHGDYDRAVALDEESLAFYRGLGHKKGMHAPLRELGIVAYHRGNYDEAVRLSEQALAAARESGSASGSGLAACNLADALRARGDLDHARTLLEESLASLRRRGGRVFVVNALVNTLIRLGSMGCARGDVGRAAEYFGEGLGLMWRVVGRGYETVACLVGMALVASMRGRPERAARLLGASSALSDEMDAPLSPIVREDHDHASDAAHETLGAEAFEAAWDEGRAMPFEESIAAALDGA